MMADLGPTVTVTILTGLAFVLVSGQPSPMRPKLSESFSAEVSFYVYTYNCSYATSGT